MRRPVFLFLLFFSLCIASTLYLFGGSNGESRLQGGGGLEKGKYDRSASVYDQHLAEAIERIPALSAYLENWAVKQAESRELVQAANAYLAHIDAYFVEAGAEAKTIQDSTLRLHVLTTLDARAAAAQQTTAALRKSLAQYTTLQSLAADSKKAAEVMGSLSTFDTYLQTNKADTAAVRKAIFNTYNLIEAAKPLTAAPAL
jgi:hypothetical protein